MAVNKVEYIKDSKVPDFAVAGDEKNITLSTAKTIDEDVKEGNTEDLTPAQQKYLNFNLSKVDDTTTYETTPGDETIPPSDEEDEDGSTGANTENKEGITNENGGNPSTGGVSPTDAMFGIPLLQGTAVLANLINPFLPTAPFGAADIAAGSLGVVGAAAFDAQFVQRMSDLGEVSTLSTMVEEYSTLLDEDLKTMQDMIKNVEEGSEAAEGAEDAEENNTQSLEEQLATLNEQLEQARAEGDEEKVAEIMAKIEELKASAGNNEENPTEQIVVNNQIGHEVFETTTSVANFLKQGNEFGAIGTINTAALAGASAFSFVLSGKATAISVYWAAMAATWANSIFMSWAAPIAVAKSIEAGVTASNGVVAGGLFAGAATVMAGKTAAEFVAGAKGSELETPLNDFGNLLTEHDKLVESYKPEETTEEGDGIPDISDSGETGDAGGTVETGSTGGTSGTGGTGETGGTA